MHAPHGMKVLIMCTVLYVIQFFTYTVERVLFLFSLFPILCNQILRRHVTEWTIDMAWKLIHFTSVVTKSPATVQFQTLHL